MVEILEKAILQQLDRPDQSSWYNSQIQDHAENKLSMLYYWIPKYLTKRIRWCQQNITLSPSLANCLSHMLNTQSNVKKIITLNCNAHHPPDRLTWLDYICLVFFLNVFFICHSNQTSQHKKTKKNILISSCNKSFFFFLKKKVSEWKTTRWPIIP